MVYVLNLTVEIVLICGVQPVVVSGFCAEKVVLIKWHTSERIMFRNNIILLTLLKVF